MFGNHLGQYLKFFLRRVMLKHALETPDKPKRDSLQPHIAKD